MTEYTIHTRASAPAASQPLLDAVTGKMGMLPNILAGMAESPALLKGYMDVAGGVAASSLSPLEQQIVQISVSRLNGCEYCIAAHTTMADGARLPREVINAVREGTPIADKKLQALRSFAESMISERGWVPPATHQAFLDAGYTKAQALDVVLVVAQKIITNYTNRLLNTPIDAPFQANRVELKKAS